MLRHATDVQDVLTNVLVVGHVLQDAVHHVLYVVVVHQPVPDVPAHVQVVIQTVRRAASAALMDVVVLVNQVVLAHALVVVLLNHLAMSIVIFHALVIVLVVLVLRHLTVETAVAVVVSGQLVAEAVVVIARINVRIIVALSVPVVRVLALGVKALAQEAVEVAVLEGATTIAQCTAKVNVLLYVLGIVVVYAAGNAVVRVNKNVPMVV